jgi:hypothetical protein
MKISRKDLQWFMTNIRTHADGKELTDEELVDQLATYMETNPRCVDMNGVSEGIYTMPHIAASQFEDFMESLQTDLPINIEIGSHEWCESECAKSLGFENPEEMRDPEKVKAFQRKKNDIYAKERGYKDWDDLLANSKFAPKKKTENNEQ